MKYEMDNQFEREVLIPFFEKRFNRKAREEDSYYQEWKKRVATGTWIYYADKQTFSVLVDKILECRGAKTK
jgi:hypothetical protein